uniref:Uncharacterized protein MANES_02G112800 n=1 Tax=Rhizophora mucronata TaxID=61149 RepID=A0A2P2QBA9_RHIMU
MWRWRRWWV